MTADATRPCRSIAVGILTVAALAGAPAAAHAQDADSAIPHRPDVTVEEYIEYVVKDLDTTWSKVFAEWGYAEPVVGVTTLSKGQSFTSACHDPGKRRVPVTDTTEPGISPLRTRSSTWATAARPSSGVKSPSWNSGGRRVTQITCVTPEISSSICKAEIPAPTISTFCPANSPGVW